MTVTLNDGHIPYRSDIIIITLSALEIAFCVILELVPGEGGGGGGLLYERGGDARRLA